jgi:phosphoribosyl-ATP pyrophosphohydrolase
LIPRDFLTRCPERAEENGMTDRIETLYAAVAARRGGDPVVSRTAKLIAMGLPKIAQKVGEEAVEVVIDAIIGNREGVICESTDLLYHLVVLWQELGIAPAEIWGEMARREAMMGIAEKLPKTPNPGPRAA